MVVRATDAVQAPMNENRYNSRNSIDNMQLFHAFILCRKNAYGKRSRTERGAAIKIVLAKCCSGNRFPFCTSFVIFSSHFLVPFLLALLNACECNASICCRTNVDIFIFASMSPSACLCLPFYRCATTIVRDGFQFSLLSRIHVGNEAFVAINGCLSFNQKMCLLFLKNEHHLKFTFSRYCCMLLSTSYARSSVARYICHFARMNEILRRFRCL